MTEAEQLNINARLVAHGVEVNGRTAEAHWVVVIDSGAGGSQTAMLFADEADAKAWAHESGRKRLHLARIVAHGTPSTTWTNVEGA